MKVAEAVEGIVKGKIEELGFALYEVEFVKEFGQMNLVVTIDSPEGVKIEDCERVSRAIEPLIDAADPISEPYCLVVSSVGLDHPLKKDRDFVRNLNQKIEVRLYRAVDKKKELAGRLASFDAESFTLALDDGREMRILRKEAALVRPRVDFR
ncbi:MAG: Ribosome maturation factor RimP [Firmicutes bacterium ADurb.Bin248]|nr:MAG: Ribosome maturation factor RimP [Firmicutes bacterium ADurb.Bin248]HOG01407.1 ribosome maturation factor RimP [Clostridia bacterium]HPK16562.1 ribosome maturation factor RimP [Clostridia bacterium]